MHNIWQVARRELSALLTQPLAYAFGATLLGLTGFIFSSELPVHAAQPGVLPLDVQSVLGLFSFLYLLAMPALATRLLSQKRRSGSVELALGNFLAGWLFYLLTAALTFIFPLILFIFGNPDPGPIWSAYLGMLLYGAALLGIDLLISALSPNRIVAYLVALGINLSLYLLPVSALSLTSQQNNFFQGVLLAQDGLYFVLVTAVSLHSTTLSLKSKQGRLARADWAKLGGTTAVFILLYLFAAQNPGWRYDSTANKALTPLPETIALLHSLDEPIHVIGFYTAEMALPQSQAQATLQTMQAYTNQLSYEFANPDDNPLLAEQYALSFAGTLVFTRADGRFAKASTLTDRALHTALLRALHPTVKTAYFLTGHGERDGQDFGADGVGTAVTLLQESGFTVQSLNLSTTGDVPADASAVFLIDQQAPLTPSELDALVRYVDGGGTLFLARDALDTEGRIAAETDGLLGWLQTSWGITLRNDLIVDATLAQSGQTIGLTFVGTQYGDSPITQELAQYGTIFNVARSIETKQVGMVTAVSLITTSDQAWGETNFEQMVSAGEVAPDAEDATGNLTVALSALNPTNGARLVVFGDTDFVSNSFIQQGGNSFLFENAANWLVDDLVSLPLTTRQAIPRQVTIPTGQLKLLQLISICLVPGLLALAGVWMWVSRRRVG